MMSLQVTVAAPFKGKGRTRMRERAFVVDLALDRNWVSPDQAKRLLELGTEQGLLRREAEAVAVTFDLESVTVPDGFEPDASVFESRSPFEEILDVLEGAGHERQPTVAAINSLQSDLRITADAAAVLYARQQGLEVDAAASRVARSLRS